MAGVLVLNAGYEPLQRVSLAHAVRMLHRRVAVVEVAVDGRTFGPYPLPAVLRLVRYVQMRWRHRAGVPTWSRAGMLARDGHRCAYCGTAGALTVDHVLPRSRGGTGSWLNTVAACAACNHHKRDRTPAEAGMRLRVEPRVPTHLEAAHVAGLKQQVTVVDTISMDVDAWIDRGRAGVGRWRDDQRQRSVQRLPLVQVRVREQVAVPLPSAEIWRFISDPANDGPIVGGAHVRTFVVPGTPVDAVGEVQCMVLRRPDGSWAGLLQQVVERVDGVRLAGRALSLGHRHLETATVSDGLLTWEAVVETRQPLAGQVHALVQRTVVEHLDRIAVLLRGEVPREQAVPFVTSCTDGSALVDVDVTVGVDLRVPAEVVWAHLRDARTVALGSSDPTATSFTVPGSRQGEVGELVCVLTGTPDGGRAATFQQVVGEEPGRAVVTRALSVVAEHAWERALHVEALSDGSRVTHRVRVPVHRRQVAATRAAWTADARRYLGAIEAALVASV